MSSDNLTQDALQKFVDALGDAAQVERAKYHLTLGELIAFLREEEPERLVFFGDGAVPGNPVSYRGYYQDLAFTPDVDDDASMSVERMLSVAEDALGNTFTGYKGGQFEMTEMTPLWKAERGDLGRPVLDVKENGGRVYLQLGDREI